jgi:predicted nucleic acid-binding protein
MIVSYELLHELETVLLRDWFRRRLTVSDVLEYVLWLRERATLVDTDIIAEVSPDPDDNNPAPAAKPNA